MLLGQSLRFDAWAAAPAASRQTEGALLEITLLIRQILG